ncbi:MAG: exodeoxyribonuclease VII small subunit [Eubacterium sp.]|nr:exodeoxyribonuclease VII small subunit [Eubacterium sp.]
MPRAKKSEEINIEDSFKRLEEITALLEKTDTKLKEAMELYTEGVKLADSCKKTLEGVEKEIKILSEEE